MQYISRFIVYFLLLLSFPFLRVHQAYAQTGTYIDKAIGYMQQKRHVDAYRLLLDYQDKPKADSDRYVTDYLLCKLYKEAYRQTSDDFYLNKMISSLTHLSFYTLSNEKMMQQDFSNPIWRLVDDLSSYYLRYKDERLEKLIACIGEHNYPLDEAAYPLFYRNFVSQITKARYAIAGIQLQQYLGRVPESKKQDLFYARLLQLSALGQMLNVDRLKEKDFYSQQIFEKLREAENLYQAKSKSSQIDVESIHIYGDLALYYHLLGKRKKADKLLQKEGRLITKYFGKESDELAWYLYHKAFLSFREDRGEQALDEIESALSIYYQQPADYSESHKYVLTLQLYDRCLQALGKTKKNFHHTMAYYRERIKGISEEWSHNRTKQYELYEIKTELARQNPQSSDESVDCLQKIVSLSLVNADQNQELIMLPSDFNQVNAWLNKQYPDSPRLVNKVLNGGDLKMAQLSIYGELLLFLQNKNHDKKRFAQLMDLYIETAMALNNWHEVIKPIQKMIDLTVSEEDVSLIQRKVNLAKAYMKLGKVDSCRLQLQDIERLLPIERKAAKTNWETEIGIYADLSQMYLNLKLFQKSAEYADKVIQSPYQDFRILSDLHKAYHSRAQIYYMNGEYERCASLLDFIAMSEHHRGLKNQIDEMLVTAYCHLNDSRAFERFRAYMQNTKNVWIPNLYKNRSQFERDSLLDIRSRRIIQLGTVLARTFVSKKIQRYAYNSIVYAKSLDLDYGNLFREAIPKEDSFTRDLYRDLLQSKDSLNFGDKRDFFKHKNKIAFLQTLVPDVLVEKCLSDIGRNNFFQTFRKVSSKTAIVEFVTIRENDKPNYYAFITQRNDSAPLLIPIGNDKNLERIHMENATGINQLYTKDDFLYQAIWKKIEKNLHAQVNNIVLVPSGILNRVNFNVISTPYGIVADSFHIVRMASASSLTYRRKRYKSNPDVDIALFGGIQYSMPKEKIVTESRSHQRHLKPIRRSIESIGGRLPNLPYTRVEIDRISNAFEKGKFKIRTFMSSEASESAFKELSGNSPSIIHMATHGFYLKKGDYRKGLLFNDQDLFRTKEQSLLYNGLLLAGAQHAWNGHPLPDDVEDGILTADEISRLDLSGTKLVVLSACESALGDIDEVEGVYGLQRAFKKAGVKHVLMSLWPVSDKATAVLMTHFYRIIQHEKNLNIALVKAMKETSKKFPSPVDWAGFVLLR